MMSKFYTTIFFIFTLGLSYAQESIDLLTVSGRLTPATKYENPATGKGQEMGGLLNLKLPIVLDSNNIWFTNLTYISNNVFSKDVTFNDSIYDPIRLHGIFLQTGWIRKLGQRNSVQLLFVPRLMGDFKNINEKNLQFGAIGMFEHRFSKRFKAKFGAMYNSEISGPFVVPLIDLDWKISDKLWLGGLVPIYSKIKYIFSDNTNAGIGHFALITSYRLGEEAYRDQYIERTSIDIFSFVRQRIAGNIHFEFRAGYALARSYEQYESDQKVDFRFSIWTWGDNRTRKNYGFQDGAYFNLRFVYNLPI